MQHHVEIDQSGKIERTQENTVLAFSDGVTASILILAVEKRECVKQLRLKGETGRTLYRKLFVAALFLLVKEYIGQIEVIAIDVEYPGQEAAIRAGLLNHIRRIDSAFSEQRIVFRSIGKKSPAHHKALAVYRGKDKPDQKVRARELLRLIK